MEITKACGDEDVSEILDVHFLRGKVVTIGEVWVTTKDTRPPRRLNFFSLSLLYEVGAQSLLVNLEGRRNHKKILWANPKTKAYRRP
jgi:hypothetical protein